MFPFVWLLFGVIAVLMAISFRKILHWHKTQESKKHSWRDKPEPLCHVSLGFIVMCLIAFMGGILSCFVLAFLNLIFGVLALCDFYDETPFAKKVNLCELKGKR